jgi:hypothetical protein
MALLSSPRRTLFALAIFSALPLLVACPKKDPPPADAAPPPPPEPEASTLVLAPLGEEDAGADADAEAGKKATGPYVPTNVARLRQCCNQLRTQARAMGASPEAGMLIAAAAQCDGLAAQAGPNASAPELGLLRTALAGRNIPPVCAGF